MKQCPKCRQLFAGGDLRFCRYDGSPLMNQNITPPGEAVTILFPTGPLDNPFHRSTDHTAETRHANSPGNNLAS